MRCQAAYQGMRRRCCRRRLIDNHKVGRRQFGGGVAKNLTGIALEAVALNSQTRMLLGDGKSQTRVRLV